jgi:hypothetical protein
MDKTYLLSPEEAFDLVNAGCLTADSSMRVAVSASLEIAASHSDRIAVVISQLCAGMYILEEYVPLNRQKAIWHLNKYCFKER